MNHNVGKVVNSLNMSPHEFILITRGPERPQFFQATRSILNLSPWHLTLLELNRALIYTAWMIWNDDTEDPLSKKAFLSSTESFKHIQQMHTWTLGGFFPEQNWKYLEKTGRNGNSINKLQLFLYMSQRRVIVSCLGWNGKYFVDVKSQLLFNRVTPFKKW